MTKIMLVEDDKSLREIYGVRLLAEGYDIVSAGDGEEALAMAIKERPQLIISDVMMPKVSGYDMLDILRSTTETKNIRVIMMTALSSEEQRARAESLGADRYLVKSQVGIEDVVRVVHEVLEDRPEAAAEAEPLSAPAERTAPAAAPTPIAMPIPTPPVVAPVFFTPPVVAPAVLPAPQTMLASAPTPTPFERPSTPTPTPPVQRPNDAPKPASLKSRVIQPLNDPAVSLVNINDLLDRELAREAGLSDGEIPAIASIDQERAEIDAQLQSFTPPEPTPVEMLPIVPEQTPNSSPSLLPIPGVGVQTMPVPPPPPPPMPSFLPQSPAPSPVPIEIFATPAAMPAPAPTPVSEPTPVLAPLPTPMPVPEVPVNPNPLAPSLAPSVTLPVTPTNVSVEPPAASTYAPTEPQPIVNPAPNVDLPALPEVPSL